MPVRTIPKPTCPLCRAPGPVRYERLRDPYFDAPGEWTHRECASCRLLWLDPQPIPEDIGLLYEEYYTHTEPQAPSLKGRIKQAVRKSVLTTLGYVHVDTPYAARVAGKILTRVVPSLHVTATREVRYLRGNQQGLLLDVGAGDGSYLAQMRALNWYVAGIEPDPAAAKIANARLGPSTLRAFIHGDGAPIVETGTIHTTKYPARSFDAITLCHVIEHVPDPVSVLRRCGELLKPNGELVISTPNPNSIGHHRFGAAWRELDPPRHLLLLPPAALTTCLELAGLHVVRVESSARNAAAIFQDSHAIHDTGRMQRTGKGPSTEAKRFAAAERREQRNSPTAISEEYTIIARR